MKKDIYRYLQIEEIIDICANILGADTRLLKSKSREKEISDKRMLIMTIIERLKYPTLEELGNHFNRANTTVIYNLEEARKRYAEKEINDLAIKVIKAIPPQQSFRII